MIKHEYKTLSSAHWKPCHPCGAHFELSAFVRPRRHGFIKPSTLTQTCRLHDGVYTVSDVSHAFAMAVDGKARSLTVTIQKCEAHWKQAERGENHLPTVPGPRRTRRWREATGAGNSCRGPGTGTHAEESETCSGHVCQLPGAGDNCGTEGEGTEESPHWALGVPREQRSLKLLVAKRGQHGRAGEAQRTPRAG